MTEHRVHGSSTTNKSLTYLCLRQPHLHQEVHRELLQYPAATPARMKSKLKSFLKRQKIMRENRILKET